MPKLLFGLAVGLLLVLASPGFGEADKEPTEKELEKSLDDAIRAFHKGIVAEKKEDQEKALRAMLPTKKDIETLFAKQAEKLWPIVEKMNKFFLENVDKFAAEVKDKGPVKEVVPFNMRKAKDEFDKKRYERLLGLLPKEVPVFQAEIIREKGAGGGPTYLYANGHWIWWRDLPSFAEEIEKLK